MNTTVELANTTTICKAIADTNSNKPTLTPSTEQWPTPTPTGILLIEFNIQKRNDF
jgi:hypothetical protein